MYCGRASRTSRGGREEVSDGALLVGARGCSVRCGGLVGCIAWKRTRRATDSVMTATDDDRPRAASERGRASTHLCLWGSALWLGGAVDGLAHARHGRLVAALCARREERGAQRVGRRGEGGRRWGEGGLDGGALDEDSVVRLVEREQAGAAVAWPALRQTRGGTERARAGGCCSWSRSSRSASIAGPRATTRPTRTCCAPPARCCALLGTTDTPV